jgi:hypothetical protein
MATITAVKSFIVQAKRAEKLAAPKNLWHKKFGIQKIYGIDSKLKSKIASNGKNGIDYFCKIEGEQHCKKV